MRAYYQDDHVTLYCSDCRKVLPELGGHTAVVTDPPYGLGFMGKDWDHGVPGKHFWEIIAKACLPGAPLMAFGGTRTVHRLVCAIEDAGWEIRDGIEYLHWIYGSGFPKSHNISKGIDKAAGAEREVIERNRTKSGGMENVNKTNAMHGYRPDGYQKGENVIDITAPATPAAQLWDGYGTALKPAHEPICLAMNPLDGTFAHNALEHGVAGLNVDGGRIQFEDTQNPATNPMYRKTGGYKNGNAKDGGSSSFQVKKTGDGERPAHANGRWPSNIIHDGSEEVLAGFPVAGGAAPPSMTGSISTANAYGDYAQRSPIFHDDSGTAARFFYCAKSSKAERNRGCEGLDEKDCSKYGGGIISADHPETASGGGNRPMRNNHPTVKPLALMRYLLTLVTMPERNLILDPFAGSGTTGVACKELGLPCVLIEEDEHHCEIIAARVAAAHYKPVQASFDFDNQQRDNQ